MIGYRPSMEEIAYHLNIHGTDLQANLRVCGDFKGFPREYLEEKSTKFTTSMRWDYLDSIMILIIFGLVLFHTEEDFMDYAVINLFLAIKVGDPDHVPALLADVYHTLHQRYTKKVGMMLCCAPLLYKWLISHLARDMIVIERMSGHK